MGYGEIAEKIGMKIRVIYKLNKELAIICKNGIGKWGMGK